jgi:Cu/Ag efflux pump CusA
VVQSIIRAALRFRVLLVLVAGVLLALGISRVHSAPADTLPEFGPPVVTIQTEALGLNQAEVEQLITVPMEQDLLNGVKDVDRITSDSVGGTSLIRLVFKRGTDLLRDRQLVQERLTQAYALPSVSKPPQMLQPTSSTGHVMVLSLRSGALSPLQLSVLARWTIRPRLMGIPGVANVSIWGLRDRQLQVLVDPARLAANKVTLGQVISTVGNAQLVSPLSYLNASTPGTGGFVDTPNQRLSIRHILPFGEPKNLGEVPIDRSRDLDVGDVASVVEGHQPMIGDAVVSNGSGLLLAIDKLPGASTLGVTQAVRHAMAELRPGLGSVKIDESVFRPATYVSDSFHNLILALAIAAGLMLLVLVALRRPWRLIVAACASISLSMVIAALLLDLLGYSFSALTFTGLAVALVVVIDAALTDGRRGHQALGFGALIAIVVAAPLFLVHGNTGAFIHSAVLAYLLAVGASLVVALTLTPALRSLLSSFGATRRSPRAAAVAARAGHAYSTCLGQVTRVPRFAALAVCVPGLALLAIAPSLGEPERPAFHDRDVVVSLEGYRDMSLPEIDRIARRTTAALERLPGVRDVAAAVGRAANAGEVEETNSAQLWVSLRDGADYSQTLGQVKSLVSGLPGIAATMDTYESARSGGVFSGPSPSPVIRIYGQDYGVMDRVASEIRRAVLGIPGVHSASSMLPQDEPVLQVQVDLQRARRYGLKPGDVRRQVSTLVSGLTVGNFFEQQKVFDVVVQGTPALRDSLGHIRSLLLDTPWRGHVHLNQLASVQITPYPGDIRHDAVSRFVDVRVGLSGGDSTAVRDAIARRLSALDLPLEYHAELLPTAPAADTSAGRFLSYALAAALVVLLLLQAAAGSWRLAVLVFSTAPLALGGGILVALAMGSLSSLGTAAGLVAVLILTLQRLVAPLTDARELTDDGMGHRDAFAQAVRAGLTPTLVSCATVAAATLPFVVRGTVAGTEILHPLAAVVLGGVLSILLVTVLITPMVCLRLGFGTRPDPGLIPVAGPPPEVSTHEV